MCLDEELYSDEVTPCKLQCITPRARDTADRRRSALSKGNQLCLVLDGKPEFLHVFFFFYFMNFGTQ